MKEVEIRRERKEIQMVDFVDLIFKVFLQGKNII